MYIAKHRIFLTEDRSRAVLAGDPEARFLLVGVGGEVDNATARRYDLERFDKPVEEELAEQVPDDIEEVKTEVQAEEAKTVAEAQETKVVTAPGGAKQDRRR